MKELSFVFLRKLFAHKSGKARALQELMDFPFTIQVAAENLTVPWALDISPGGRILITERIGRIRVIENGKLDPKPLLVFQPPFVSAVEGGLMGIALDPDYMQNHYIYVMHTFEEGGRYYNRVVRLIERGDEAYPDRILLDKIPGGLIHNGGRLKVGPDRKLYITTGDAGMSELAQDPESLAGKILRINLDGSIPEDNPFPGSPVYSLGHRNPQGLTWNQNGILYASEHGASAHDEINIILPGENYGWPLVQGDEDSAEIMIQKPFIHSGEDTWAPSGISFVSQGGWKGRLLAAALRGRRLLVFRLNRNGTEVRELESRLQGEYGRLRDVVQAADGSIYLLTSNRDGRGNPVSSDDRVIRLVPRG